MESRCTVLFFDEIDALGQSRGDGDSGNTDQSGSGNNSRRILAELLIQMTKMSSEQVDDSHSETDDDEEEGDDESLIDEDMEDPQCMGTYEYNEMKPKTLEENIEKVDESFVPDEGYIEIDHNNGEEITKSFSRKSTRIISPTSPNKHSSIRNDDNKEKRNNNNNNDDDSSEIHHMSKVDQSSPRKSLESNQSRKQEVMVRPRVLVVAATNRPEDCDPALLRRFGVRVLVGLPTARDRRRIIERLLSDIKHSISRSQLVDLAASTDGWAGSDLESLTREAVMAPIRECLRETAVMKIEAKRKKRRQQQQQRRRKKGKPNNTIIIKEDESGSLDENELARDFLLSRLENLRFVTVEDFENAARFWMGNSQHQHMSLGCAEGTIHETHYDTHSDSEDDDEEEKSKLEEKEPEKSQISVL